MNKTKAAIAGLALAVSAVVAQAGEVEVLHYWTSGGEAKSVAVLKDLLTKEGHDWKDFAVAGGAGEAAMTVLKSRAVSGNAPAAAQMKGLDIQEWADLGFLADLDGVAKKADWDNLLPSVVSDIMKYEGKYVAVPVNVHRVNWLWANPEAFKKAGVAIPTTWADMIAAGPKLKAAGIIPLAHGGQAWQDATLFEAIALGMGGSEFYTEAFVKHDDATLRSAKMIEIFKTFKATRDLIDADSPGRDWNVATSMVINGTAAMQVMGDWAKGEFTAAGKVPGKDFVCAPAPQTEHQYTFNIDSFALFNLKSNEAKEAQNTLARLIMEPKFQETFNLNKGSIPVRQGMNETPFDSCAKLSMADFSGTAKSGDLVPSFAHGMATTSSALGAISDVVTNFFNSEQTAEVAVEKLANAVKASM
jgi:glucose/mannose transport system substrate-binding protein